MLRATISVITAMLGIVSFTGCLIPKFKTTSGEYVWCSRTNSSDGVVEQVIVKGTMHYGILVFGPDGGDSNYPYHETRQYFYQRGESKRTELPFLVKVADSLEKIAALEGSQLWVAVYAPPYSSEDRKENRKDFELVLKEGSYRRKGFLVFSEKGIVRQEVVRFHVRSHIQDRPRARVDEPDMTFNPPYRLVTYMDEAGWHTLDLVTGATETK